MKVIKLLNLFLMLYSVHSKPMVCKIKTEIRSALCTVSLDLNDIKRSSIECQDKQNMSFNVTDHVVWDRKVCKEVRFTISASFDGTSAKLHSSTVKILPGAPGSTTSSVATTRSSPGNCSVELRGGAKNPGSGNVWVTNGDGRFGPVCQDSLDLVDVSVVCKELGYQEVMNYSCTNNGNISQTFAMFGVACTGNETSLCDCGHSTTGQCDPSTAVSVTCSPCSHGVQLRGGIKNDTYYSGNVWATDQNGIFRPVCREGWDLSDTIVVCRQLGFYQHVKYRTYSSYFGSVPITAQRMKYVACKGNENCLHDCRHDTTDHCSSSYGIGVTCYDCGDRVELKGGIKSNIMYSGNVWVTNKNGTVGPVCHEDWDLNDATVVCRQLGYFGRVEYKHGSTFGRVPDSFAMDRVACTGAEDCLADCSHTIKVDCCDKEGAGVICFA